MDQMPASPGASLASRLTRRRVLRGALGAAGALAASVLVACGGRDTAGGSSPIIQMTADNTFTPQHVSVYRGYPIFWTNVSKGTAHSVVCDPSKAKNGQTASLPKGAQPFDSNAVAPNSAWSITLNVPGEYVYFDQNYGANGMVGRITVRG